MGPREHQSSEAAYMMKKRGTIWYAVKDHKTYLGTYPDRQKIRPEGDVSQGWNVSWISWISVPMGGIMLEVSVIDYSGTDVLVLVLYKGALATLRMSNSTYNDEGEGEDEYVCAYKP